MRSSSRPSCSLTSVKRGVTDVRIALRIAPISKVSGLLTALASLLLLPLTLAFSATTLRGLVTLFGLATTRERDPVFASFAGLTALTVFVCLAAFRFFTALAFPLTLLLFSA